MFRKDRNKHGGGVALYINNSLTSTCICTSTEVWTCQPGTPDYIFCKVKVKGIPPFFTAAVYRPPYAPSLENSNFLEDFTVHMHNYSTQIIIGDFNANQLCNSFESVFIRNLLLKIH